MLRHSTPTLMLLQFPPRHRLATRGTVHNVPPEVSIRYHVRGTVIAPRWAKSKRCRMCVRGDWFAPTGAEEKARISEADTPATGSTGTGSWAGSDSRPVGRRLDVRAAPYPILPYPPVPILIPTIALTGIRDPNPPRPHA